MKRDFLDVTDFTKQELIDIIGISLDIKRDPSKYSSKLAGKTLLMIFEKPSLRTRISFEVGMTQLGGHAIYYNLSTSPMGKKESVADTAKTSSRYVDIIMARLFFHEQILEFSMHSSVPVINALTDHSHPCQIVSDLVTIKEKKGGYNGIKLAYFGDSNNNVTHSLMHGCSIMGIDIYVACPAGKEFEPLDSVYEESKRISSSSGSKVVVTHDPAEAAKDADIIYTDSWMSYHIPEEKKEERRKIFLPYQVNPSLMKHAKKDAVFMNCLPAMRGMEQTGDVIDGKQSIVFDQAENRLHAQKAIMLRLLGMV